MKPLSEVSVSNVYVYVGDAVRWDALPDRLAERGMTIKTVAASIHTPTSFASIVTGLHPPQHGIWDFSYRLNDDTPNLLSLESYETAFANTIDEKFNENPESESVIDRMLNTTKHSPDVIETIDPPFIFIERGPGGHAPYGDFSGNGWEYYRERKAAFQSVFREEYSESVEQDVSYFESQIKHLDERGLLEDTLVIYTSDHGELLGEEGCLGHNSPIHPKLAYVPTVLIHPSIDNQIITDALLNHVDLLPTIAGLLGKPIPELPGRNLIQKELSQRGACFYNKSVISGVPFIGGKLVYESVWDTRGGYVFPRISRATRALILFGKLLRSAKREYMREHLRQVILFYLSDVRIYGTPTLQQSDSEAYLQGLNELPRSPALMSEIDENAKARLQELGYLG